MQATAQQPRRAPDGAPLDYERYSPEQTTLYRLVQQHAASFIAVRFAGLGGCRRAEIVPPQAGLGLRISLDRPRSGVL